MKNEQSKVEEDKPEMEMDENMIILHLLFTKV